MRELKGVLILALAIGLLTACCGKKYEEAGVPKAPEKKVEAPKRVQPAPTPRKKVIKPSAVEAFHPESIHFEFDSAKLLPKAREILDKLAAFLRKHPQVKVRIEGNCDERGTEEYNLALGQRRADSAKGYLISHGVSPDRITTISYGEDNPVCFEHNESCWWRNRRCDFRLSE